MQDDPKQQEILRRKQFSFRLNVFFFIVFVVFSVLIVRLAVLQFVEGPTFTSAVNKKWERKIPIAPIRGNIYDANGYPIAYSTSTQSLYYNIQSSVRGGKSSNEQAEEMAEKLAEVFEEFGSSEKMMTKEDIIRQMDLVFSRNIMSTPRRIKTDLTNEELAYIMENQSEFVGVSLLEESVRNYDESTIAVQLVGYLKKYSGVRTDYEFYKEKLAITDPFYKYLEEEEVGLDGIEYMYQDVLRGTNGVKTYPVNNQGTITGDITITNPEKGADLYLTIDKEVQLHTEQSIMNHLEKIRTSPYSYEKAPYAVTGFAVAMEVETGKVISMASMPDYDPNVIWSGGRITPENLKNYGYVLNNGTIRTVYGPYTDEERSKHPSSIVPLGSTIKPLSVLIGLNEGLFTTNQKYNDTGRFSYGRKGYETYISNSGKHAYGLTDGARAIEKSSNTFMADWIGNRLYMRGSVNGVSSLDIWDSYMKQFGLGVTTGSGLFNESAGVIDYYSEAERGSTQSALVQASFGQQGRYTTLQLAQYAATLANRGVRLKPQFVNEIRSADGELLQSYKPEILNEVDMPDAYWQLIEKGMGAVGVQGFTGFQHSFNRKTGTSEQDVAGKRVENAVFIAYAPAENPKLAVAVVVPEGGFGSWGAAPIARQIFDAYDAVYGLEDKPNDVLYEELFGKPRESTESVDGNTTDEDTPTNNTAE
ncbi:peptidoglycan D,D-transpeptidase FtsI family protein [Paenibacillus endoradicis]|uniref:peptidoglycan D,D-transpeptidase FtsI family protein n=1 Tax=Paenibacillus endoradicis TaxID=2972487 RepID=UPI0021590AF7|nr:penicillin-binding protein 2 [Paenibacillus endoradicis]MCR8659487.1 penicillin-binding protein 2 [Paenibacillus endoradicis]